MWIFVKDFESFFQLCHTIVCTFSTQHVYLYVVSDSNTQHLELHKHTQPCTERPRSLFTQGLLDRPHYFMICGSISLSNHLVEYSRNVLLESLRRSLSCSDCSLSFSDFSFGKKLSCSISPKAILVEKSESSLIFH